MRPEARVRRFRETRYPHKRSEGLTTRRTNGDTRELIREASKPMSTREALEYAVRWLAPSDKARQLIDARDAEVRRETLREVLSELESLAELHSEGAQEVLSGTEYDEAAGLVLAKLEGSDAP